MSDSLDKRNPEVKSKAKPYEGFTKLLQNASPSDLVQAIRDARRHISGAYHLPPSELDTGELKSLLDYSFELAIMYPERKAKVLNEDGLTPEQVAEITGIEANEELDQQERAATAAVLREKYKLANQQYNEALPTANSVMAKAREKEVERFTSLPSLRAKAVNWLLEVWMSPSYKRRVENDPTFIPTSAQNHSQPYDIFKICQTLFGHRDKKSHVRKREALAELEAVYMKSTTGFTGFLAAFTTTPAQLTSTLGVS